jgi:hypothetical protein
MVVCTISAELMMLRKLQGIWPCQIISPSISFHLMSTAFGCRLEQLISIHQVKVIDKIIKMNKVTEEERRREATKHHDPVCEGEDRREDMRSNLLRNACGSP